MRTMHPRSLAAWLLCAAAATLPSLAMPADAAAPDDPYLWLEDVQGDKALAWVRERNAETLKQIAAREEYAPTRERLLEVLNSRDRIPMVARRGEWLYNLWQDADHKRGLDEHGPIHGNQITVDVRRISRLGENGKQPGDPGGVDGRRLSGQGTSVDLAGTRRWQHCVSPAGE